jgi:hypothetical protein
MEDPSLEAGLRDLRQEHSAARARLTTATTVSRLMTMVLVLVLVGFVAAIYSKVTAMYAPENFEAPLQEEARNLVPRLEPELKRLWGETAPLYGQMAMEKFETALPIVEQTTLEELATLRTNLTEHARDHVDSSLDRISRDLRGRMQAYFPELSTPEGAEALGQRWMESVEQDFEQILLHFHERYAEDLGELEATLEQFRNEELENMPKDELTRQFIHLWLMKMDRWVMLEDRWASRREDRHD